MYIINNMYMMKNNMLIRLKCYNCQYQFFKKINSNNFFCTKDCMLSYKLNNLKNKKAIPLKKIEYSFIL